jgi:lysyl-tRNA synthetase class 1
MADTEKQGMFWADQAAREVADAPSGMHVVSDAKTPSGRVHVGSLRGVIVHDVLHKGLLDAGKKAEFVYRFDDFDPMDSFPAYLPEKFKEYMGKPLCNIPSPEPGFDSFAQYYAVEFETVFEALDCHPRIVWMSKDYKAGLFDDAIKTAIGKAADIREINERISGGKKQGDWLPVQVVCDECGRIGTTQATDFDGETVAYTCAGAKYSPGCGHAGRKSPFNGGSKLTWKAHWAAQWQVYNVTVEGEGKDHAVIGGSRQVSNEIATKVFGYKPPYDLPYEFFLIGGKKMSSSKGLGSTAKEVSEALPPELLRFLLVRYKPRTAINFSPEGETLPRLYDDYDTYGENFFGRRHSRDPDEPRIYEFSQVNGVPKDYYRPQFSFIAYLLQVPHLKLREVIEKRIERMLTQDEAGELERRSRFARNWLEKYAGEEYILKVLDHPSALKLHSQLAPELQKALADFGEFFEETTSENAQTEYLKRMCERHGVKQQAFYEAAYNIFLGKPKGPRLLPFLNALERPFVAQRLRGVG